MSNRLHFPCRSIKPTSSKVAATSWRFTNGPARRLTVGRRASCLMLSCWMISLSVNFMATDTLATDAATTDAEITRDANLDSTQTGSDAAFAEDPTSDRTTLAPAKLGRREVLLASLTVFVLAVFLGFELITKVPPTLHTPLMSGSNAISGITLVGAILSAGLAAKSVFIPLLGMLAVVMATINAVGGFAVTHRMLGMFRRK